MKIHIQYFIVVVVITILLCFFFNLNVLYLDTSHSIQLENVALPTDSPMNQADSYVVITQPYVSLKDNPDKDGISVGHVRKKEVYQVKGKEFVSRNSGTELWIHIANGWLACSCVEFYSSKGRALTASRLMQ